LIAAALAFAAPKATFIDAAKSVAMEGSHVAALVAGFFFAATFPGVVISTLASLLTGNVLGAVVALIAGGLVAVLPLLAAALLRYFGSS
jgi:formate/nitrite transporter FocA (FNT family)